MCGYLEILSAIASTHQAANRGGADQAGEPAALYSLLRDVKAPAAISGLNFECELVADRIRELDQTPRPAGAPVFVPLRHGRKIYRPRGRRIRRNQFSPRGGALTSKGMTGDGARGAGTERAPA